VNQRALLNKPAVRMPPQSSSSEAVARITSSSEVNPRNICQWPDSQASVTNQGCYAY